MNRERAKELLPIIQAFTEGKTIQSNPGGEWEDYNGDNPIYVLRDWRIKPLEFPPLPDGLYYHNPAGLTPEQVGPDHRPVVKGECTIPEMEVYRSFGWEAIGPQWVGKKIYEDHGASVSIRVPISTPFPSSPKKKVTVSLGPEDIGPEDVIRQKTNRSLEWIRPEGVSSVGVHIPLICLYERIIPWDGLQEKFEIKRPGDDWQPCEKEAAS